MVIMGIDFKSLKDEIMNSSSSPSVSQKKKKRGEGILDPVACFFERTLLERETYLEIHKIQPSAVFGARRKNVLRGAGYAWTLGL